METGISRSQRWQVLNSEELISSSFSDLCDQKVERNKPDKGKQIRTNLG